jgi:hypothetical protein
MEAQRVTAWEEVEPTRSAVQEVGGGSGKKGAGEIGKVGKKSDVVSASDFFIRSEKAQRECEATANLYIDNRYIVW